MRAKTGIRQDRANSFDTTAEAIRSDVKVNVTTQPRENGFFTGIDTLDSPGREVGQNRT